MYKIVYINICTMSTCYLCMYSTGSNPVNSYICTLEQFIASHRAGEEKRSFSNTVIPIASVSPGQLRAGLSLCSLCWLHTSTAGSHTAAQVPSICPNICPAIFLSTPLSLSVCVCTTLPHIFFVGDIYKCKIYV